jgi:hypothetical protein
MLWLLILLLLSGPGFAASSYSENGTYVNKSENLNFRYGPAISGNGTSTDVDFRYMSGDLSPSADNAYNLGSGTRSWKNVYLDGTIYQNGSVFTGGGTECSTSSCELNSNTTVAGTSICLSDGTNCAAAALGAVIYKGVLDASGAAYPVGPAQGDYYIISVAGTISGKAYLIGDWAVYNGSSWDKVDNSTVITPPGGSNTQIQYNNAGAFAGIDGFIYNGTAISSTKNIGIGSTTPTQKLDVVGTGKFSTAVNTPAISNLTTNGIVRTGSSNGTLSVDTTTYLSAESDTLSTVVGRGATTTGSVSVGTATVSSGNLLISAGNVGVGSATPTQKIDVVGTVKATAFSGPLTGNVTGNASGTAATVTGAAQANITSVGTLTSLLTSGNVGVGTTASRKLLDVEGAVYMKDNVGIGVLAASAKLHVVGGARVTGLVSCDTIDTDSNGNMSCGTDDGGSSAARVFYVKNSGSDAADGLSDATAFQTIAKVEATQQAGDVFNFHAGDTWREMLTVATGVTYQKYGGSSVNPVILGSTEVVGSTGNWTDLGGNIWKRLYTHTAEVGDAKNNVVFNNANQGTYDATPDALYDYYYDADEIFVYATSNPATLYSSIEAAERIFSIYVHDVQHVTIDGIDGKYAMASCHHVAWNEDEDTISDIILKNFETSYCGNHGTKIATDYENGTTKNTTRVYGENIKSHHNTNTASASGIQVSDGTISLVLGLARQPTAGLVTALFTTILELAFGLIRTRTIRAILLLNGTVSSIISDWALLRQPVRILLGGTT